MAAGIAYITARKHMATDLRVVKLPAVQGRFARRYQSASDGEGGKGSEEGGGKLHVARFAWICSWIVFGLKMGVAAWTAAQRRDKLFCKEMRPK
jgi:hypothetical protein